MRERVARILFERGGLIALCALVAYAWLAPDRVIDGDNAEFSILGAQGGIAHPSGYPLYVLWLRALSWLPGSPAHAAAVATAVLGAATVLVLHAACRAWGARPLAATLAVGIIAGAPIVARLHSEAEVFALNNLVVGAILWLAAREGPLRGGKRAAALGLLAGLGLSNHLTCVLVAPVGCLGVVRAARESSARAVAIALAAFVVGLLPYAYAFIAPDTPMAWGPVGDIGDLVGLIGRRDYGGATTFNSFGESVSPWTNLEALVSTIGRAWLWAPALLGVVVLVWRAWRPSSGSETRLAWVLLGASFALAGPALVLRFNIPPVGVGLEVCRRFHVLPALVLAIPIAVGLEAVAVRVTRTRLAPLVAALAFPLALAGSLPYLARVHTPAVERFARDVVGSLPRDAVVIVGEDYSYAGIMYVQWALGQRQDVIAVSSGMLVLPWYRNRLAQRGLGMPIDSRPLVRPSLPWVVERALASGRRVFVDLKQKAVLVDFPSYPYGAVVEVLARGSPIPPLAEVVARNRELYAKYELGPRPSDDDEYAAVVHRRYAATWQMLEKALDQAGDPAGAAAAADLARELGPAP